MQMQKNASGKKMLKMSRAEWERIGRIARFMENDPDDYMGQHSFDTEIIIDGKPVPVRVGFDAHVALQAPRESLGQPLGEDEPSGIEIVGIWGIDPSDPNRTGDSVMNLLGNNQIEEIRRKIEESH